MGVTVKEIEVKELTKEQRKTMREHTKMVAELISKASPKDTKKYSEGWTNRKRGETYVVYNKERPKLTHLLEFGHATQSDYRVPPIPHIRPVIEATNKGFVEKMADLIEIENK